MNAIYVYDVFVGFLFAAIGVNVMYVQLKQMIKHKRERLDFDYKMLAAGIGALLAGLAVIVIAG